MKTLLITAEDIKNICRVIGIDTLMSTLIEKMGDAFHNYDPMKTSIPIRSGFNYKLPVNGLVEWMPLHELGKKIVIKTVGYHPSNPSLYNEPTILSNITSYDIRTGHLMSIMDGVLPTALRTGAASALTTDLLSSRDSNVLGLIGCGAQSITQLHAISKIRAIDTVLFYDIDKSAMSSFEQRVSDFGNQSNLIPSSIEDIMETSDIVCTATSIGQHEGPLFKNLEPKPHLHINAVGSDFPGKIELPYDLLKKAYVVPDFKKQAKIEGECQQLSDSQIGHELDYVVKRKESFLKYQSQLTVFDSTGYPLEDQTVSELILEYGESLGIGTEIEIEGSFSDVKNPYSFLESKVKVNK